MTVTVYFSDGPCRGEFSEIAGEWYPARLRFPKRTPINLQDVAELKAVVEYDTVTYHRTARTYPGTASVVYELGES